MSRRDSVLLKIAAGWTLFVWGVFIMNLLGGNQSTGFKAVHLVLAVVSMTFGVIIWGVAARNRRRAETHV